MPLISVVIPIYNTEPYLEACLLSIIDQRFSDFEVICVDDLSKDRSREIVQDLQRAANNPLPELTGWTVWLPNAGSPAVRSSNLPFAAPSALYSNAVLFRNIARLPLLNAAIASLALSGG